ncbi:signal peptidase I [Schumannella sp. 10F1B-5-1]|uniref:signal peptidase I n=1 Tax=Schumannella sp. 10F1B-5-1 TaxID=2590780 RepID=UPI00113161A7|nr:signal peptidase I [Schumannella sp. 10F1B-5-1]TPW76710.1 signal peptidase I [Schumannella sp. 10F1B-5-1]
MVSEASDPGRASGLSRRRRLAARPTGWKGFLRDLVVIVLAAVLVSALVKTFLVRSFFIPSPSMAPTLQVDDRILVNQLQPRLAPLAHGDIVVFRDPGGWLTSGDAPATDPSWIEQALGVIGLTAPDSREHLVKRVIGLPGDHVVCCNGIGQMTINGVPVDEADYADYAGNQRASRDDFDVTVPDGALWVEGDNRYDSQDSRFHLDTAERGFVPLEDVVGRAVVITWPVGRWAWLDDHPAVFADVPEREG